MVRDVSNIKIVSFAYFSFSSDRQASGLSKSSALVRYCLFCARPNQTIPTSDSSTTFPTTQSPFK